MRIKPPKDKTTLEGFVASRFGWRLYEHFFKTQSEKVWGVPCTEIQADWGAQRIKDLSIMRAVKEALTPKQVRMRRDKGKQVTSLIEEFNYPKYGPGQMWERCTELVTEQGTKVVFDSVVTKVEHADGRATAVTAMSDGVEQPLRVLRRDLVDADQRAAPGDGPAGARRRASRPPTILRYRAHITVALVVPEEFSFPDNWIYINDANVKVGRVQNFGRWSPYLVKDGRTCLGLELFVNEGDEWWTMSDEELIATGKRELEQIGLLDASKVEVGLRGAHAEGVPVLRRATTRSNVDTLAALARGAHAQRVSGRPQRHAPLQQPGPLDVHRDALGREHLRRRTTTSGR